ncbi:MAG TPA: hypothetical protein PKK69_05540 [Ferruginibacter sp.]|nr:hypothetical protein [Ferruginibacter sp.]
MNAKKLNSFILILLFLALGGYLVYQGIQTGNHLKAILAGSSIVVFLVLFAGLMKQR